MQSKNNIISVIVPIFQTEADLPKCVESIINQTYRNLNVFLIDDDSPDNCGAVCEQYAKIDKRIHVFHIEHRGLSGARNFGIQKSLDYSSDFITFVDSDDWIEPNMFELLLEKMLVSGADVVECGIMEEYPGFTIRKGACSEPVRGTAVLEAIINSKIRNAVWNKLWKAELFRTARFPEGRVFEEIASTYKFLEHANVDGITEALYHYVQRYKSISHNHDIGNLRDFWLAHFERYRYCIDKVASPYKRKLLDFCAMAIARAWWWQIAATKEEKERYAVDFAHMNAFVREHYPLWGFSDWALSMRVSIFLTHFNNTISFALAYAMKQFYKQVKPKSIY